MYPVCFKYAKPSNKRSKISLRNGNSEKRSKIALKGILRENKNRTLPTNRHKKIIGNQSDK